MIRRPPSSTRTDTLFPYTTLFRSQSQRVLEEHGARFGLTGGTGGQRQEPTGTNYGGTAPSWTRRTLEAVIAEHLAECQKVGYVDWHTGFGDYGEPFFLCTHPAESVAIEQAAKWWGREAVTSHESAFQGANGSLPKWQGMFAMALDRKSTSLNSSR